MRLLPPKELNTKINDQKKSDFDAGMFLAKKIDKLREDLADTQKEHDDGIEKLKKDSESFAIEKSIEKTTLIEEIRDLKEKKRILLIPLDLEWEKVRLEKIDIQHRTSILVQGEEDLLSKQRENIILSAELSKRKKEIENCEIIANKNLLITKNQRQESDQILSDANKFEIETKKSIELRTKEVLAKETDIAYRELDIQNNLKNIADSKAWIKREKSHIEARQRALKVSEQTNVYTNKSTS